MDNPRVPKQIFATIKFGEITCDSEIMWKHGDKFYYSDHRFLVDAFAAGKARSGAILEGNFWIHEGQFGQTVIRNTLAK
jgi:hypothetical protein